MIGLRNMIKALLIALLEPTAKLQETEGKMDFTGAAGAAGGVEESAWPAVWDYYCLQKNAPDRDGMAG